MATWMICHRGCEHTGLVTVRLLDTSGGGGSLTGGLGGELLTGSLATSGLTCKVNVSR